jgi:hypothetical protein
MLVSRFRFFQVQLFKVGSFSIHCSPRLCRSILGHSRFSRPMFSCLMLGCLRSSRSRFTWWIFASTVSALSPLSAIIGVWKHSVIIWMLSLWHCAITLPHYSYNHCCVQAHCHPVCAFTVVCKHFITHCVCSHHSVEALRHSVFAVNAVCKHSVSLYSMIIHCSMQTVCHLCPPCMESLHCARSLSHSVL